MLGEVRQTKMVDILNEEKSVTIRQLSEMFDVSEETIRRDLKKLEQQGLVKRTHGGAMLNEDAHVHTVPPISQRAQQHQEEKIAIANAIAQMIPDRATVMLDNGSTTLEIAKKLINRNITLITNDLTIAMEVSSSLTVNLMVLGGFQQKGTFALCGAECEEMIRRYHVDVTIVAAGGIGSKQGLTTSSSFETQIKRLMMEAGNQVYCVADPSKLGKPTLISYAQLNEVDAIVTTKTADPQMLQELEQHGAHFLLV